MDKMELLDLSGNSISPLATSFSAGPAGSNTHNITTSSVVTVIIGDGFVGLKEISLRGCANLKNLLVRGVLQDLCNLDISGTAVKTLDLSAMTAPNLDEVYLLGCDKLCAILWPRPTEGKRAINLNKLRIDTNSRLGLTTPSCPDGDENNNKEGSTSPSSSFLVLPGGKGKAPNEFEWYISVRDVRFLLSLEHVRSYYNNYNTHVEISSPTHDDTVDAGSSTVSKHNEGNKSIPAYADVGTSFKYHLLQAREGRGDDAPTIITETWPCPNAPSSVKLTCYMNIQDKIRTKSPLGVEETINSIAMPGFICDRVLGLHVHDTLSMASIPVSAPGAVGGTWAGLCWCRVERCPNFDCVFTTPTPLQVAKGGQQADGNNRLFWSLGTFWGSQLPKVRFIWNWGTTSSLFRFDVCSFGSLKLLHLDLCPRLIHVLPLPMSITHRGCLGSLVTLEIVWCSDLEEIFPFYSNAGSTQREQEEQRKSIYVVEFRSLKHIHLHELPRLRSICGGNARLVVPSLEALKIRGCWSLRCLPAVNYWNKNVKCDCEKEWWDRLERDGLALYQPTHPRYYKKRMFRGSVLV